jgi:hypothetical protein
VILLLVIFWTICIVSTANADPIITPIATALASVMMYGGAFSATVMGWATAITTVAFGAAVSTLSSLAQSLLSSKTPAADSQSRNGHLMNYRSPGGPIPLRFGLFRGGATWPFWQMSGAVAGKFNIIAMWGQGEWEGIAKDFDSPQFEGKGLNDFRLSGTFTGTDGRYEVKVKTVGGGGANTFQLSKDGGGTWGAETPMDTSPVSLGDGLFGQWGSTSGHTANNSWKFTAGDALWLGDSLMEFYKHYKGDGAVRDLVDHYFHSGSATQTVDTNLQAVCPLFKNTYRNRCYSYVQLSYSETAWSGIPEMRILGRCIKLYDPRSGFTSWYQTTAVKGTAAAGDTHVHVDDTSHMTAGMFIRFTLDDGTTHTTTVNGAPPAGDVVNITAAIPASRSCVIDAMVEFDGAHAQGRNPALVWRWYVTNARTAMGRPVAKMNEASVISAANWTEANGFYFDGEISTQSSAEDNLKEIEKNFRAYHIEIGGVLYLKIWSDDSAVMSLSDAKGEISLRPEDMQITLPGFVGGCNKMIVHYCEPSMGYADAEACYEDEAKIISDGEVRPLPMTVIGCKDIIQARRIAKFEYLRWHKYNKELTAIAAPRVCQLEPGDMCNFTIAWPGWTLKKFRVKEPVRSQDSRVIPLTVMEEDSSIYDLTVDTTPQVPIVPIPGPATPDMSGYTPTVTSAKRGLKIDWTLWDDTGFDIVKFVVYVSTDPTCPQVDANKWGEYSPKTKKCNVTGLTPGLTYYVVVVPYDRRGAGVASEIA